MARACAVLAILAAGCSAPPEPVHPAPAIAAQPRPVRLDRVEVPEVVVVGRLQHGEPVFVIVLPPQIETLEPGPGVTLATDRTATAALGAIVRDREALQRERTRSEQVLAKARELGHDDPAAQKVQTEERARITRVNTKLAKVRDRLIDGLAHARLTRDGRLLHVVLVTARSQDRSEDARESALTVNPGGPEPQPDYRDALAVIDAALVDHPDDVTIRYLQAFARREMATTAVEERAVADSFLALARREPKTAITEPAYYRAADYFSQVPDAAALAIEAYRWLSEHAARPDERAEATYFLGRLYERVHDPLATETFCKVMTDPAQLARDLADSAEAHAATDLASTQDVGVITAACAAKQCPCTAAVLNTLATRYAEDDYLDAARAMTELVLDRFPLDAEGPQHACMHVKLLELGEPARAKQLHAHYADRYAPGSPWANAHPGASSWDCPLGLPELESDATDETIAARTVSGLTTLRGCLEADRGAHLASGAMTLEVTIGTAGVASRARATASSLDVTTTRCVEAALQRHRWLDLDQRLLVVRLRFEG